MSGFARCLTVVLCTGCVTILERPPTGSPPLREPGTRGGTYPRLGLTIYDNGTTGTFFDDGGGPREFAGAARVDLASGGWRLRTKSPIQQAGALVFEFRAEREAGEFLTVQLMNTKDDRARFPVVHVARDDRRPLKGGWSEVALPIGALNPENLPFDTLHFNIHA